MDLSTIKRKLDTGQYMDPWQYVDDVWLMFDNAWLYNRKTSKVYKYCSKVRGHLNFRKWGKYRCISLVSICGTVAQNNLLPFGFAAGRGLRERDRQCDAVVGLLLWAKVCVPPTGAVLLWQTALYHCQGCNVLQLPEPVRKTKQTRRANQI